MAYHARQGDIIWIKPHAGLTQKEYIPALVVSSNMFNDFVRTSAMVCPIVNTDKAGPLDVKLDEQTRTPGVVMCSQAKVLNLKKRSVEFIERAPDDIVIEAVDIISGFIEIKG
ncbi:MAG: type II toxin-antitoxin system PemK/MazF family toxin [Oscillospiraceae bacterium]|nr:type II toxin-antitoxin system PemK/MazF family toxin [Oscillospiraceae bacterium]